MDLATRINQADPTLPPEALEKKWSAGYDQHGGDRYVPVEAQEILDFAPLVKEYTWNKSDDEKAEAFPSRFIPVRGFFYLQRSYLMIITFL